jgi:hypothetical protein
MTAYRYFGTPRRPRVPYEQPDFAAERALRERQAREAAAEEARRVAAGTPDPLAVEYSREEIAEAERVELVAQWGGR